MMSCLPDCPQRALLRYLGICSGKFTIYTQRTYIRRVGLIRSCNTKLHYIPTYRSRQINIE